MLLRTAAVPVSLSDPASSPRILILIEFAVGKLDVKQRVLEGNDLLSPLAVQGDGNLGHSIFSSSVSRG